MAIEGRIRELSSRHQELETRIETEVRSPASDGIQIAALKRQKLKLKEELEALQSQTRH
jgi:hypothetical protein